MTIPPIQTGGAGFPPVRQAPLTAPVLTGVPPVVSDEALLRPFASPPAQAGTATHGRQDPPISLGGRLDQGDVLPDATRLALSLESATRALQHGRASQVLAELDAVWSNQLAADSPWYLRTAALQLLGRTSDAEQVLRNAIERLPRSAAILYLLGVHTSNKAQYEAAKLASDHALALHPTEPLLWLQRAALAQRAGQPELVASLLQQIATLQPSFPAAQWLATLAALGDGRARSRTPSVPQAIPRLTPSSLPALSALPAAEASAAQTSALLPALESALRYGLTLLDSPTQSARTAIGASGPDERGVSDGATWMAGAQHQPPPAPAPQVSWPVLALAAGVIVIALVPPLRTVALLWCGGVLLHWLARPTR